MDFQSFLAPGYQFVHFCLTEEHAFPPFALILENGEDTHTIIADDGLVETVREAVLERARQKKISMVAMFSEAEVETGDAMERVIHVHLDIPGGLNRLILTPFRLGPEGMVRGKPS